MVSIRVGSIFFDSPTTLIKFKLAANLAFYDISVVFASGANLKNINSNIYFNPRTHERTYYLSLTIEQ